MSSKKNIVTKLMDHYYPNHREDPLDAAFSAFARPGMKVLDAACGGERGLCVKAPLKDMHIVGVDIDPSVHNNPTSDETVEHDLSKTFPFEDDSFDLIHCRWAIEHFENPEKTFCEFARILKPGGKLICLTPNVYHYAVIAARITPFWFHHWWRGDETGEAFPTYYRGNSPMKLRQLCKNAGLEIINLKVMEGAPGYLTRCWPLFLCGVFYERIINSTPLFSWIRHCIVLEAEAKSRQLK